MLLYCIIALLCCAKFSLQAPTETGENNEPLFLSKYIESNNINEGKSLAKVNPFKWNGNSFDVPSYSGLLTVNKTQGSHMFFWYFPAENQPSTVPLLVWLNGFSTASSYGVFLQNGPYDLSKSDSMVLRNTSWQKYYHIVYIDNPVGVGFSFTDSNDGYVKNFDTLSNNLFSVLEQFYTLFPELSSHELYLTGLSMAGKYISSLAYKVYETNSFNFKGIFLGNPLLDLKYQLNIGDYLLQLGFLSKKQERHVNQVVEQAEQLLQNEENTKLYGLIGQLYLSDNSYVINVTGLNSVYNYYNPYIDTTYYEKIMNSDEIKQALHVGNMKFNNGEVAMNNAADIFVKPVTPKLEQMVEKINILIYAGQLDIVCAYPMLVDTLESLNWSGKSEYANADRIKLYNNDSSLWGYKKTYKTLTDVLVLKAGHSAVSDKPEQILSLLLNLTDYSRFK